jgi:hypothetical protein
MSESKISSFEAACAEIAGASAKLTLTRDKPLTGSDVVATIEPNNIFSARIDARLDLDFGVYLLLGHGAPFEIPFGGGDYTNEPWLDEMKTLCRAVVLGRFEEELISVGNRVRRSNYRLCLESGVEIAESWGRGLLGILPKRLLPKRDRRLLRYEPYRAVRP